MICPWPVLWKISLTPSSLPAGAVSHLSEHWSGGHKCFAQCSLRYFAPSSLQYFESHIGLGFKSTDFEGPYMSVIVQEVSRIVSLKICIFMQDVPIGEETNKAEKPYYQNDKWTICTSVPIPSPVPQFMTLPSFVNERTFASLLPKYYQRVILKSPHMLFYPCSSSSTSLEIFLLA